MFTFMHIKPVAGANNTLESKCFHKHKSKVNLVFCCKFFLLKDFVTVFPSQTHGQPNLILP